MRFAPVASRRRPGTVVCFLAISLVAICALLSLAIDLGMVAIARSQCQNCADAAALAGVRLLNGDASANNNKDAAIAKAQEVAKFNIVNNVAVTDADLTGATKGLPEDKGE